MAQPPSKLSGRNRTPQPVNAENYAGAALQDLVNFFGGYHRGPQPEGLDVAMQRIVDLGLLAQPEHRYGIAGAVHAIMHFHAKDAKLQTKWRTDWVKQMAVIDACRPSEEDSEVTRPPEIDYLWMYGTTLRDEYTIDRIIRIGARTDLTGDAAVRVAHYHSMHPLMLQALARAAMTTTTQGPPDLTHPFYSVRSLTLLAAKSATFQACVLCIGWRPAREPRGQDLGHPEALVAKTPDGNLPRGFPTVWDNYAVVGAQATAAELANWHKLHAVKDHP